MIYQKINNILSLYLSVSVNNFLHSTNQSFVLSNNQSFICCINQTINQSFVLSNNQSFICCINQTINQSFVWSNNQSFICFINLTINHSFVVSIKHRSIIHLLYQSNINQSRIMLFPKPTPPTALVIYERILHVSKTKIRELSLCLKKRYIIVLFLIRNPPKKTFEKKKKCSFWHPLFAC